MNTLTSTFLFKSAIEKFPNLRGLFKPEVIEKYAIPDSYYNHYYKIFQNKKYPLTKYMLQLARENRIGLVNFSDPEDMKNKSVMLPPYFTCITSQSNGKRIVYSNAIKRAGYNRNAKTQEITSLKIDEMALFGYLYSAAAAYLISSKSSVLESNFEFISACAEIYTMLVTRCISSREYPIGSNMNEYTRLNFITSCYFLQSFIGYDVNKSIAAAMRMKIVDKSVIENECILYNHQEMILNSFDTYIRSIEKEFSFIRPGSLTIRAVSYHFIDMYGETAFFAMEHFQNFLNMVENAYIGTGIYHDMKIKKGIYSGLLTEIDRALLKASES